MNDKLKINLQVGGTNYPLIIEREEERFYREAAKQINNKLNLYRQKFSQEGADKIITMVALDIAFTNAKLREMNNTEPFLKKLDELNSVLNEIE